MDNIVLSAFGEPVDPEFSAHLSACPSCQAELDALTHTAELAREGHTPYPGGLSPSTAVWDGIAAELGLESATTGLPSVQPEREPVEPGRQLDTGPEASLTSPYEVSDVGELARRRSRRRPRAWTLAVAAAALTVVAGGVGYLLGHGSGADRQTIAATARLAPMPGGPAQVAGTAELLDTSAGKQLTVSAVGLPSRSGYYEVWLFSPGRNQMVAVGTLAANDTGTFPVPAGLNPSAYSVVDVSAQHFDGNPVHQQSVLRGELSP